MGEMQNFGHRILTNRLIDRTVVVGAFQCNCRLLACPKTGEAVLVDPGDEPEAILSEIERVSSEIGVPLQVKYLLHTHAHLDHIGATRGVREKLLAPKIALH